MGPSIKFLFIYLFIWSRLWNWRAVSSTRSRSSSSSVELHLWTLWTASLAVATVVFVIQFNVSGDNKEDQRHVYHITVFIWNVLLRFSSWITMLFVSFYIAHFIFLCHITKWLINFPIDFLSLQWRTFQSPQIQYNVWIHPNA